MITAVRYSVSWCYREGDKSIRRTLFHHASEPCIEAARLINSNPYSFDVEVLEVDTGERINWTSPAIGRVLVAVDDFEKLLTNYLEDDEN